MKTAQFASSILLVPLILLQPGCKSKDTASGNAAKPAATAASNAGASDNSNRSAAPGAASSSADVATKKEGAATEAQGNSSPQLLGSYEMREIRDKGIVTMVSQIKTVINFSPEGTYSRVSERGGRRYHSDSGQFRIEKPDKLVLSIQVIRERSLPKIKNPPLQKTHVFSLSPDGDELKLTSEKGTAVFRRVSKPKA